MGSSRYWGKFRSISYNIAHFPQTTPRPLSGLQIIIDLSVDSSFKAFKSALVKIEENILHDLKL